MKLFVYLRFISVFTFPYLVQAKTKEKTVRLKWNIENEGSVKANKFNFASKLWPNTTIHYYIWSAFTSSEEFLINQAIDEFRKHTCITFTLFDNIENTSTYKTSLWIEKSYIACNSSFGYTEKDFVAQDIYLFNSCMTKRGIVLHLLRTLGVEENSVEDYGLYYGDNDIVNTSDLKPQEISAVNKLYKCSSLKTTTSVKPTFVSYLIHESKMTTPTSKFDGDSFRISMKTWPNATVDYYIGHDFTLTEKQLINMTLDELQENTCIKFIIANVSANLGIMKLATSTCSSSFGRRDFVTLIFLGDNCHSKRGILVHLLRILGVERIHSDEDGNTQRFLINGLTNSEIAAVNSLYHCSSASASSLATATPPAHDFSNFRFSSDLWNLSIKYHIETHDFTPTELQLISEAVEEVQKNTCIQFLRSYWSANLVFESKSYCSSDFGLFRYDRQSIWLSHNCKSKRGILLHLLRSLGIEKRIVSGEHDFDDSDDLQDSLGGLSSEEISAINYLYKCPSFVSKETKSTVALQQMTQPPMVLTTGGAALKLNCKNVEWHVRRAFELADHELLNATNFLYEYFQFWFGGKWTVILYDDGLSIWTTDFQTPNLCSGATITNISGNVVKYVIFEHVPTNVLIKMNCDCWLTSLDVKIRRFSGNVQKAVSEIHEELRLWFPGSSFTVLCGTVGRHAIIYTSEQICHYIRPDNQTACYTYQH